MGIERISLVHRLRPVYLGLAFLMTLAIVAPAGAAAAEGGLPLALNGSVEGVVVGVAGGTSVDPAAVTTLRLRADLPLSDEIVVRAEGTAFAAAISDGLTGLAGVVVPELAQEPDRRTGASLDRLYARIDHGSLQTTVGRQRISWGGGAAFAPADYFNPPNPLDPDGPRAGVDGIAVTESLGPLSYVMAAGAWVERAEGLSTVSGHSGGVKVGTHVGTTDISLATGYDGPADQRVTALEAKGDLGVGWQGALVQREDAATGETHNAGMAGIDYSFADGQLITNLEYQYDESASDRGQWYAGVTYVPDETSSLSVNALYAPDSGDKTLVTQYARQLSSVLDLEARLMLPIDRTDPVLQKGMGQVSLKYSF